MLADEATRKRSSTPTNTCLRCEDQLNMDKQDGKDAMLYHVYPAHPCRLIFELTK